MPPKKQTPPPIDRPLSKAYLRGFKGWSTAYPPGLSDPATVRVMENVQVGRNGALCVRPGLRNLTYNQGPDMLPLLPNEPGYSNKLAVVGSQELFYLDDGQRAVLYAVRETSGKVGFRVLLFHLAYASEFRLTDPEVGFKVIQGEDFLEFEEETTYVRYLQINNLILALSDSGEAARMFYVGADKWAKRLASITVPGWETEHKPVVMHPQSAWIEEKASETYYNNALNPTFDAGTKYWSCSDSAELTTNSVTEVDTTVRSWLEVRSLPTRRNLATSPLRELSTHGVTGWAPHPLWGAEFGVPLSSPDLLKIETAQEGRFYATGARYPGIEPGKRYVVAVTVGDASVNPEMLVDFQGMDGVTVDSVMRIPLELTSGRYVSPAIQAPLSAVSMKLSFGAVASPGGGWLTLKDLMVVLDGEDTTPFDGDSGTDFFWEGDVYASASVYHPPVEVEVRSSPGQCLPGKALSIGVKLATYVSGGHPVTLHMHRYSRDGEFTGSNSTPESVNTPALYKLEYPDDFGGIEANSVQCVLACTTELARGVVLSLDEAMIVPGVEVLPAYFDGNTRDTDLVRYSWANQLKPHESPSVKAFYASNSDAALNPATPTANSLISSDATKNTFKMGFFYTFENEIGESTPSMITEVRMMRAWSDWKWEEPGADGPDSTAPTKTAERCADQLVVQIPEAVYNQAIDEGALAWNLYVMSWSESEAVPVTGLLVNSRPLRTSLELATSSALPYDDGSWLAVTPARRVADSELGLPSRTNRVNYSEPPRHRSGLVAGDRMILVGDPTDLASIQWSSNRAAESTNFSVSKGGGRKTLTSGNLNIPADVVLWQNPQSVDTITVLCMGDDGRSVAYYMSPSTVNQGQSGVVSGMGFEQVTGTPGTSSPYGALVANNALFRPLDQALMKTTANNYNISHKTQSDLISNMWQQLRGKQSIVAAQLDNRLYLLVHNPQGELLEPGCKGNEIWVYDIAGDTGTWSRYLIQANSLNVFSVRNRARVVVGMTTGLYYLDDDASVDDVPADDGPLIGHRPIPWYFETNTQGANRAHDAWAHLQGVLITMGSFHGTMRYGLRGQTANGIWHDVEKEFTFSPEKGSTLLEWDVEDQLLVRRDFKEWIFYGGSVGDEPCGGEVCSVQYRYTPVSVNIGYEYGSVETFEYGSRVSNSYADNGIPLPYMDYSQP